MKIHKKQTKKPTTNNNTDHGWEKSNARLLISFVFPPVLPVPLLLLLLVVALVQHGLIKAWLSFTYEVGHAAIRISLLHIHVQVAFVFVVVDIHGAACVTGVSIPMTGTLATNIRSLAPFVPWFQVVRAGTSLQHRSTTNLHKAHEIHDREAEKRS